jgi:hypothetical protein
MFGEWRQIGRTIVALIAQLSSVICQEQKKSAEDRGNDQENYDQRNHCGLSPMLPRLGNNGMLFLSQGGRLQRVGRVFLTNCSPIPRWTPVRR